MGTRKRERAEAPEVGAMMLRMFRALERRAAEGDTEALEVLAGLERTASATLTAAGQRAHDEAGYSYTELGRTLRITRQAARQRFGRGAAELAAVDR